MSRNLTVDFKRVTYLVEREPETLPLGGNRTFLPLLGVGKLQSVLGGKGGYLVRSRRVRPRAFFAKEYLSYPRRLTLREHV
jgi:hypothetical protein